MTHFLKATLFLALAALLSACVPAATATGPVTPRPPSALAPQPGQLSPEEAAQNFIAVVEVLEPVAEQVCRETRPRANCDFLIVVDDRPRQPPNAFQTLDPRGRPVLGFTLALIADARNADEVAFVVGHEAAHHIANHIPQTQQTATTGAVLAGILATASGASPDDVRKAQEAGAAFGARTYAKDFELEADAIGAEISLRAGFDPIRGSVFFDRLPDPGDQFLGTHPPNAKRKETVRRVVQNYR